MSNYYGHQQPTNGFYDITLQWCRSWLNQAPPQVNKPAFDQWLVNGGLNQICDKLVAALGPNPDQHKAMRFVYNEMNVAGQHKGFVPVQQVQQPQPQMQTGYGFTQPSATTGSVYSNNAVQPQAQTVQQTQSVPDVKEEPKMTKYKSPSSDGGSSEWSAPGSTGDVTYYESQDESRFCHIRGNTTVAFNNNIEIVNYLQDIKKAGRCIVQLKYLNYKRFDVPSDKFAGVIDILKKAISDSAVRNMSDVELFDTYREALKDVPSGMVDKLTGIVLEMMNEYTRSRCLQNSDATRATIQLGMPKDIYSLLTNDSNLENYKTVKGYKGRIREILYSILSDLSNADIDTGTEFGAESPWLTMCGNLPLPDGSGLVRSAYLSPDRDAISIQKELAKKYTIVGIPKSVFVVFDTPGDSAFSELIQRRTCMTINQPRDDIEFIIASEIGGIESVDIILVDPMYPYAQLFTYGLSLDNIPVITRW